MSNERKIHEMLDTGLSDSDQQQLFSELSSSQQLRDEFNMQLDIHNITKEDMYSITPPKKITGAIFSGLGFSGVASIPWWSRLSSNYIGLGLSAFLASVLTYWFTTNSDTLITDGNLNNDSKKMYEQVLKPQTLSLIPESSANKSFKNNVLNNMNSLPPHTGENNSIKESSNYQESQINTRTNSLSTLPYENSFDMGLLSVSDKLVEMLGSGLNAIGLARGNDSRDDMAGNSENEGTRKNNFYTKQENITKNTSNNSIAKSSQSEALATNSNPYYSPNYFSSSNIDNGKWVLTVRNVSNPKKSSKLASSSSALINTVFGAQYRIFSWWGIGIEVGYEYFPQEYTVLVAGNRLQNWQQNPDLVWGGFATSLEYSSLGFENVLFPYAHFSGGFSSVGTIAKGQIGFKLKPLASLAFFGAWEYSQFWYGVRANNYTSNKDAYSFGVAFSF